MVNQQPFSHGLLYSVSPADLPKIRPHDADEPDGFDWEGNEPAPADKSLVRIMLDFLKGSAGY